MSEMLFVSPTPTHPTHAGNRARIRALMEFVEEQGIDFHFAFFRQEPGDEQAMIARWGADRCSMLDFQMPKRPLNVRLRQRIMKEFATRSRPAGLIPHGIDEWCDQSLLDDISAVAERQKPRCVQITYAFFSKLFSCFEPSTYKLLDTQDVISGRHRMFLDLGRKPEWFSTTTAQEAVGIRRADCVLAIQDSEADYFQTLTSATVATVGHIVELKAPSAPVTQTPTAVFLGSGNAMNQDAVHYLLRELWPRIHAQIPNSALEIYGGICQFAHEAGDGVVLKGKVAELAEIYDRAWVVLSPLRMGTGMKVKSIEALGLSKALVCLPDGCTGLEKGADFAYLLANTKEEFIEKCIYLLCDRVSRSDLEAQAYEFAVEWNEKQRSAFLNVLHTANVVKKR